MPLTFRRAFTVAGLFLVSACDSDPTGPQWTKLNAAEARWARSQPPNNSYTMRQQVACFCAHGGSTFSINVVAGTIVMVRDPDTGRELPAEQRLWFKTIDQLFVEVRSALKKPDTLREVEYDAQYGYPTLVSLDPLKNAIDDEVVYFTSGFAATP